MNDVQLAFRQLTRTPGSTASVVATLALGLGVNASVFFFVSDFFLRPLPVKAPDQLVYVLQKSPRSSFPADFSYPDYLDLRAATAEMGDRREPATAALFSGIAAIQQVPVALGSAHAASQRVWVAAVSDNFFTVLGIEPGRGRLFADGEGRAPGADPIVVLTHDYWRSRFGASPSIVGQPVMINSLPFIVIGITPAGFHGPQWSEAMSAFVPASMLPAIRPGNRGVLSNRGQPAFRIMGRVRPGVSLEQARSAVDVELQRLIAAYPLLHVAATAQLVPEWRARPVPKAAGFTIVIVGAFAVGALLILAVAIANAANLLFARAADRERELAIRSAIGASRRRLLRQLLTESTLLAVLAGTIGFLIALWIGDGLTRMLAAVGGDIPPLADYGADWRPLIFTFAAALGAGVLAALMPAWRSTRLSLVPALKDSAAAPAIGRQRIRRLLVIGQVALSCVVLVAAGLALRSARALARADLGFRTENLLLASYDLGQQRYVLRKGLPRAQQFHAEVLERAGRLPGVRTAALAEHAPFDAEPSTAGDVIAEGQPTGRGVPLQSPLVHAVSHTFRETMAIPLVAGRDFLPTDDMNAPRVALINEALARRLWPNDNAVGRRIVINRDRPIEVVGVVRDGRFLALAEANWPAVFLPLAQNFRGAATLLVRTISDPLALAPAVERIVRELEPDLPLYDVRTMEQQMTRSPLGLMPARFGAIVVGTQALLGLVLALTGIYGLVSYSVARRTHEIGVRMALGANSFNVTRLVAGQSLGLAVVGLIAGVPLALVAVRPLGGLLYGIAPADPIVFTVVPLLVLAVALAACWLPARRATRVNPINALRAE